MNKEIDEIALEVAHGLPCIMNHIDAYVAWTDDELTSYAHALLAELAKVSEPVAYYSSHRLTPDGTTEFYGYTETKLQPGTPLYLHPLPQPDLVAENERLREELKLSRQGAEHCFQQMRDADANADVQVHARKYFEQQLSAAQPDLVAEIERIRMALADTEALELGTAERCKRWRESYKMQEQQLSAAQADNEQLVKALNNLIPLAKVGNYDGRKEITDAEALAAHKARQQPPAKVQFDALMKGENADALRECQRDATGWVATHLKSGREYLVTGESIHTGNEPALPGDLMVEYRRDGKKYVRAACEFQSKFAAMARSAE